MNTSCLAAHFKCNAEEKTVKLSSLFIFEHACL